MRGKTFLSSSSVCSRSSANSRNSSWIRTDAGAFLHAHARLLLYTAQAMAVLLSNSHDTFPEYRPQASFRRNEDGSILSRRSRLISISFS